MKTVLLSTCLAVSLILTACGNKKAAVTEPEATANQEASAIATTGAESREEPAEMLLAVNLYGSDCLVLFYEDFQSSFSYTRLGYLEEPEGLSEAAGSGSVTVTFEPAENAG